MTEFRKALAATETLAAHVAVVAAEDGTAEEKKAAFDAAEAVVTEWEARVCKMKAKADEPDPDKRTYGKAMVVKVHSLYEQFYEGHARLQEHREVITALYRPIEEQRQAQLNAELLEEERRNERERRLQEEVERRLLEEEEELRREAEQREREREEQHRLAIERAARIREEYRERVEQEKRERGVLLAYLNATPTRVLLHKGVKQLFGECQEGTVTHGKVPWLRLFDDTIRSLQQFSKNLAGHPDSTSLKQLRYSNENFSRDILSRGEGALHVLYSLGYRPAGYAENRFLMLDEIDPVGRYTEWEAWWEEVKWTRDYLAQLVETLRNHRRGVATDDYDVVPHLPPVPEALLKLDAEQMDAPVEEDRPEMRYYS